jgi:hypothetical protein
MAKRNSKLLVTAGGAALALAVSGLAPAVAHGGHGGYETLRPVTELESPRGVDTLGHGRTLVTEGDGSFSLVVERRHKPAKVIELGSLGGEFAPAIAAGRHGTVWLLTGASGPPPEEELRSFRGEEPEPVPASGATLYKWRWGWDAPKAVADIAAYQAHDLDPFDLEDAPEESNPFGLAALHDGSVLVADAAGNDLLRVWGNGRIKTVARLMPRVVEVPEGLPDIPPEEGGPLPPAGTPIPSEAVATSVTVGKDGYWYVGELRGFPATPGTSQIWRIKPGTTNATCNPEKPWAGKCKRYADGLTSLIDLGTTRKGILALSLSKLSWFQVELGVPGSEIGGLFLVKKRHSHGPRIRELVKDQLPIPGGVDASRKAIYVTAPLFGPGALWKIS